MRVAQISESDIEGGAARAAYRLHKGLCSEQLDSQMYVQSRKSDDFRIHAAKGKFGKGVATARPIIDLLPAILHPGFKRTFWGTGALPFPIINNTELHSFDVVHLHWVSRGFLPVSFLKKIQKPLVWTLHDMWPFTGGCHYTGECNRYEQGCGVCPQLGSSRDYDLSRWIWKRKAKYWKSLNLTIVTPSRWLADCARRSSLFCNNRIEVIPNGIDTQVYKPIDKVFCRELLGIPVDINLVLFGAIKATSDQRKGYQYLQPALEKLSRIELKKKTELLIVGSSAPAESAGFKLPVHYLGKFSDDISMSILYSAADVVVTPSMEDNLPNVVMEAMACGTPCVSFDIGGLPDMIDHHSNGFLVKAFDVDGLAHGLSWALRDRACLAELSRNARLKVEKNYSLEKVAGEYKSLYEDIIGASK